MDYKNQQQYGSGGQAQGYYNQPPQPQNAYYSQQQGGYPQQQGYTQGYGGGQQQGKSNYDDLHAGNIPEKRSLEAQETLDQKLEMFCFSLFYY